jgi:hypothetical protein
MKFNSESISAEIRQPPAESPPHQHRAVQRIAAMPPLHIAEQQMNIFRAGN